MTSTAGVDSLIAAWLGHLSVEKGVSANTLSNYRRDLKRYRDWLVSAGKTDLADVTTADVEAYVADLRRGDPSVGRAPLAASSSGRALVVGYISLACSRGC